MHGHLMDGRLLGARLCAHPKSSLGLNPVQTLQKVLQIRLETEAPPPLLVYQPAKRSHTHVKDPVVHVRDWWSMKTTE